MSVGRDMSSTVDDLVLDLLDWLVPTPRPYREVLEAWRTSCPRLPVWEEANDRGFIERRSVPGCEASVAVSAAGAEYLGVQRPPSTGWLDAPERRASRHATALAPVCHD
jgi:D-3-phosphoglycerate dehydrogenase